MDWFLSKKGAARESRTLFLGILLRYSYKICIFADR